MLQTSVIIGTVIIGYLLDNNNNNNYNKNEINENTEQPKQITTETTKTIKDEFTNIQAINENKSNVDSRPVNDYLINNIVPFGAKFNQDMRGTGADKYNLGADYIKYNLYKQPNPNAYLAQFAEFMILNKDSKYIQELIKSGIQRFAKNMILQFKEELKTVPVHFAGSIAFFCQDEIKFVAEELGFKVGNFERRPIEGLVVFHTKKA